MKAGVCTLPWASSSVPRRASPSVAMTANRMLSVTPPEHLRAARERALQRYRLPRDETLRVDAAERNPLLTLQPEADAFEIGRASCRERVKKEGGGVTVETRTRNR